MKRNVLYLLGIILLCLLCSTCRKEHIAPINQLVKDLFCFKTGSEWIYYDSVSQTTQKMVVTNYEATRLGAKSIWKTYDFVEMIEIKTSIKNLIVPSSKSGETFLEADMYQDNTAKGYVATPAETGLSIRCDENNNFSPSATYLGNYIVNGVNYSDVYVFKNIENTSNYMNEFTYYVSKHTGFIRCVRQCEYDEDYNFDWVLTNKNVKQ